MYADSLNRAVQALGYKDYSDYLSGPHWKGFSASVRQSRCFCCGRAGRLSVHHVTYERLGGENSSDVVTVCQACHEEIHDLTKQKKATLLSAHLRLRNLKGGRPPGSGPTPTKPKRKKRKTKAQKRAERARRQCQWPDHMVPLEALQDGVLDACADDVIAFLRAELLMEEGSLKPTTKAFQTGMVRRQWKKDHWNQVKYLKLRRAELHLF